MPQPDFIPQPIFDTIDNIMVHMARPQASLADYIEQSGVSGAQDDFRYALEFLYSYRGSPDTFASYRRELERLLHWAWYVRKSAINKLKRLDIEAFIEFCQQPPKSWIGTKTVARFVDKEGLRAPNEHWRPFVVKASSKSGNSRTPPDVRDYALSPKALQAIFSVLSSFFNYLIQEEYGQTNPVALIRQKSKYLRKHQHKAKIRRLTDLQWMYVVETAEEFAAENPAEHERTLFVIQALYGMYLRVSELTVTPRWTPQMGDFHMDMDGNWWFTTVGKGNKERDVSVSDAMLAALKRYRHHQGLALLPAPGETTPLVQKNRGRGGIGSTRQIRNIVQFCFDEAIARLQKAGFEQDGELLRAATVHWLRHTGISDDVKHRPREHVRDDAGHGSSAITDKYIDVEMRARHQSARKKLIKPL